MGRRVRLSKASAACSSTARQADTAACSSLSVVVGNCVPGVADMCAVWGTVRLDILSVSADYQDLGPSDNDALWHVCLSEVAWETVACGESYKQSPKVACK